MGIVQIVSNSNEYYLAIKETGHGFNPTLMEVIFPPTKNTNL